MLSMSKITQQMKELLQQLSWHADLLDLRREGLTEEELLIVIIETQDEYWEAYQTPINQ